MEFKLDTINSATNIKAKIIKLKYKQINETVANKNIMLPQNQTTKTRFFIPKC